MKKQNQPNNILASALIYYLGKIGLLMKEQKIRNIMKKSECI